MFTLLNMMMMKFTLLNKMIMQFTLLIINMMMSTLLSKMISMSIVHPTQHDDDDDVLCSYQYDDDSYNDILPFSKSSSLS